MLVQSKGCDSVEELRKIGLDRRTSIRGGITSRNSLASPRLLALKAPLVALAVAPAMT